MNDSSSLITKDETDYGESPPHPELYIQECTLAQSFEIDSFLLFVIVARSTFVMHKPDDPGRTFLCRSRNVERP